MDSHSQLTFTQSTIETEKKGVKFYVNNVNIRTTSNLSIFHTFF